MASRPGANSFNLPTGNEKPLITIATGTGREALTSLKSLADVPTLFPSDFLMYPSSTHMRATVTAGAQPFHRGDRCPTRLYPLRGSPINDHSENSTIKAFFPGTLKCITYIEGKGMKGELHKCLLHTCRPPSAHFGWKALLPGLGTPAGPQQVHALQHQRTLDRTCCDGEWSIATHPTNDLPQFWSSCR